MQLINLSSQELVVEQLFLAQRFSQRFWGLMGKKELNYQAGLLLVPCSSIHTWFMRFPLDIVFLDRDLQIVKIVENLPPFRGVMGGAKAYMALELLGGRSKEMRLAIGDQLALVNQIE